MIKDKIILSLTIGLLFLLIIIIGGDFYIALHTNRMLDENIITLMQMSITGMVGIISGYVAGKKTKDEDNNDNTGK